LDRRIRYDLIETTELLNGDYNIPREKFFLFILVELREHQTKPYNKSLNQRNI